jgi:hypothetical protein
MSHCVSCLYFVNLTMLTEAAEPDERSRKAEQRSQFD